MFDVNRAVLPWKEAGSFPAQLNLFGFWDESSFLTKSGDLGSVLRVTGVDYESLDRAGRDYTIKRLEAALRVFDERMRLYQIFLKRNRPVLFSGKSIGQNPRREFLERKRDHLFQIEIYWVVVAEGSSIGNSALGVLVNLLSQPQMAMRQLRARILEGSLKILLYDEIAKNRARLEQAVNSLSGQLSDLTKVELSGAEETLRLLRRLTNFRPEKLEGTGLHGALDLDWQVAQSEIEAHPTHLRFDDQCVRVLTLKELPSETRPLLLQGLFDVKANFHVVTEWHPVDPARARKEIASRRRHHHNSKTSFLSNLQDRQSVGPRDELVDDSKEAAISELGAALTEITLEGKSFGEFTLSVVVYDRDLARLESAVTDLNRIFTQYDALLYEERYNLLNAFFATVPGNKEFNLRRQWALNSNIADLSFFFGLDRGEEWNSFLERESLAILESQHGTPYHFNLHSGDVAHTLLLGATGSGKSFALAFLLESLQKYRPLTFVFDLGGSYESLTRVHGGTYLNVGLKDPGFSINPFSLKPTDENLNFLYLFLKVLVEAGGRYELTPEDEKALFVGLERIYKLPAEIRTLTNFASILGPLGERLNRWTNAGQFGHLFDNVQDTLRFARFQTFNFDGWSEYPDVLEPMLFFILGRASAQIEAGENMGVFKTFVIDEAWIFLKNRTIREWITRAEKTWRKKNAAMILATQSVVELSASDMLEIVNESCPTKIFLANPNMDRKLYGEIFQLNDTELELLSSLVPKREMLLVQPQGTKKLILEVDALTYWILSNNARDNLRRQEYFSRFGPELGLRRLAEDYPHPLQP